MAYYFGILALLCCVTPLPLGLVPLVLGISGLKQRAKNPAIKGSVHAWIGIVLGGLSTLGSIFMVVALVAAMLGKK